MACFVKIGDINGESKDERHKEWIDVLSVGKPIGRGGAPGSGRHRKGTDLDDITPTRDRRPPVVVPPIKIPRLKMPVIFHLAMGAFFPMLMQAHRKGEELAGRLEHTDRAGRILASFGFRGGRITRIRVVSATPGKPAPDQIEMELVAEHWGP